MCQPTASRRRRRVSLVKQVVHPGIETPTLVHEKQSEVHSRARSRSRMPRDARSKSRAASQSRARSKSRARSQSRVKKCHMNGHGPLHEESSKTIGLDESFSGDESDDMCPVTGFCSNVLEEYFIFPTVLGSGHYGTVRECLHRQTRKNYAIKSIEKSKIGRLDHLRREVMLLSKMNHGSIMKMKDVYEDAEYVHIITEKYTGGELFDKIIEATSDDSCFEEDKAARIIKSLLEAVSYLHKNGVVHRDIKPENILFEKKEDGVDSPIKLIDFGLSRRHDAKREGMMSNPVGTAYYMSPELLKGKYDKSCDVWSVGIVAYILLCGYPPFNGETDPDIFEAIKKGSYNYEGQPWTKVSDEAKDFIACLLQKDPRKRFSAEEALRHPWILKSYDVNELVAKLQRLRKARGLKPMSFLAE